MLFVNSVIDNEYRFSKKELVHTGPACKSSNQGLTKGEFFTYQLICFETRYSLDSE